MPKSNELGFIGPESTLHQPDFLLAELPPDLPINKARPDLNIAGESVDDLLAAELALLKQENILTKSQQSWLAQFSRYGVGGIFWGAGYATGMLGATLVGLAGVGATAAGISGLENLTGLPIVETINNFSPAIAVDIGSRVGEIIIPYTTYVTDVFSYDDAGRATEAVKTYYTQLVGTITGVKFSNYISGKIASSWQGTGDRVGAGLGSKMAYPLEIARDLSPIHMPKISLPNPFKRNFTD